MTMKESTVKYQFRKINKRLCIVDNEDNLVYSIPNHMKGLLRSRFEFEEKFIDRINDGEDYNKVVLEFEEELWNRRLIKIRPHMFRGE